PDPRSRPPLPFRSVCAGRPGAPGRPPRDMIDPATLSPAAARAQALKALWTFPAVLLSAFVVGWAAEAAQFIVSQGLALAVLAWLQTLPEFAVEAVIAWHRDIPLMTANFTGSLRL